MSQAVDGQFCIDCNRYVSKSSFGSPNRWCHIVEGDKLSQITGQNSPMERLCQDTRNTANCVWSPK